MLLTTFPCFQAAAQAELTPWGNLTGIRIDGQLMELESSLRLVKKDWTDILSSGKEKQRPKFERKRGLQIVTATSDKVCIFIAALGDQLRGNFTIHLVNRGAARIAKLTGLPATIRSLHFWVTDKDRSMQEEKKYPCQKEQRSSTWRRRPLPLSAPTKN